MSSIIYFQYIKLYFKIMKALFYIWLEEYWSASLIFHKLHSPFLMFFRTKLMSEVLLKQQIKLFRISFKSSFCFIDVKKQYLGCLWLTGVPVSVNLQIILVNRWHAAVWGNEVNKCSRGQDIRYRSVCAKLRLWVKLILLKEGQGPEQTTLK